MHMQQTVGSDFTTRDLHLAAYLLASDHPLRRLNGPPGQRSFVFGNVSQQTVAAFYSGATVDARKLLNAVRDLKALLHQGGLR
jgi:predicted kinase